MKKKNTKNDYRKHIINKLYFYRETGSFAIIKLLNLIYYYDIFILKIKLR